MVSNQTKTTNTAPVSTGAGVQAVTNDPFEAISKNQALTLPQGSIVEAFDFSEVSKGGQYRYVQDCAFAADQIAAVPELAGMKRPALFNAYRGNEAIYLSGATMATRGFVAPEKQLKRFALVLIPLK